MRASQSLAAAVVAALAIAALLLTSRGHEPRALAHAPHTGLDFSMAADMDGDTVDDCGTAAGQPTTCTAALHAPFRLREYLDSLGNIPAFRAVRLHFGFSPSVSPAGPPHSMWPGCSNQSAVAFGPPNYYVHADCTVATGAPSVSYTGLVGLIHFVCSADGTLDLRHAIQPQHTLVRETDSPGSLHAEGADTSETLSLTCAQPAPYPTDTDGDGCPDEREASSNELAGGQRNFFSAWDYFNPTGDGMNRMDDVVAVLQQYFVDEGEPGYSVETDRSAFGPNGWNVGPPDGRQRIDDVVAAVNSYRHDCS